jgi:hypothetical protein
VLLGAQGQTNITIWNYRYVWWMCTLFVLTTNIFIFGILEHTELKWITWIIQASSVPLNDPCIWLTRTVIAYYFTSIFCLLWWVLYSWMRVLYHEIIFESVLLSVITFYKYFSDVMTQACIFKAIRNTFISTCILFHIIPNITDPITKKN